MRVYTHKSQLSKANRTMLCVANKHGRLVK